MTISYPSNLTRLWTWNAIWYGLLEIFATSVLKLRIVSDNSKQSLYYLNAVTWMPEIPLSNSGQY